MLTFCSFRGDYGEWYQQQCYLGHFKTRQLYNVIQN